jgi:thiamine biosynthesis protein ThiS
VSTNVSISIQVNGEPRTTAEGQTLLGLLAELRIEPVRVAIELDRRIVKQPRWADTALRPGSEIEIVQFVGGG